MECANCFKEVENWKDIYEKEILDRPKTNELGIMKKQKKEYIIVGSDNHWYASTLNTLLEAEAEIGNILQRGGDLPEKFYIFEAKEVMQVKGAV